MKITSTFQLTLSILAAAALPALTAACATNADCQALTAGCFVGVCQPDGNCAAEAEEGMPCDDGNLCTSGDTCDSVGVCQGGAALDCSAWDTQCSVGTCDVTTGTCVDSFLEDFTPCDDADSCTTGDYCLIGVCTGTSVDCSDLNDQCNTGTCDASGTCVPMPKTGHVCDDGESCTYTDTCTDAGVCQGISLDCSGLTNGDLCLEGICNAGQCEQVKLDSCTADCTSNPRFPLLDPVTNTCVACLWGDFVDGACVCHTRYCHNEIGQCATASNEYDYATATWLCPGSRRRQLLRGDAAKKTH